LDNTNSKSVFKLISEKNAGVQSTVDLLAKFEIHVLPLVNPDGYEYSHTTVRH